MIAPLWHHAALQASQVFYKQTTTPDIIQAARERVKEYFPTPKEFIPTNAVIATWCLQDRQEVRCSESIPYA